MVNISYKTSYNKHNMEKYTRLINKRLKYMKSKRVPKILILILTLVLCVGNVPLSYAAEFSSGEKYSVDDNGMETIGTDGIFSDSVPGVNIADESGEILTENEELQESRDELSSENSNEDEVEEDVSADIFTDTEIIASEASEENSITSEEFVFINPLYEDVITVEDLVKPEVIDAGESSEVFSNTEDGIVLFSGDSYQTKSSVLRSAIAEEPSSPLECSTIEEAGILLRNSMKKRETTVQYIYDVAAGQSLTTEDLYKKIEYAIEHTGNPTEGDYLKYQFGGYRASVKGSSEYYTVTWTITYYTTAEQEKVMDQAVASLLNKLKLTGKSDYEKVSAIYDYICTNVKYDYANLNNAEHKLKYSGYAALVNKTAVCQGYAVLMYRLLLECGVDNRIVAGVSYGEKHSWNIIKLGNTFYNVDATWDAGYLTYRYFLKCQESFTNHTRSDEYAAEIFCAKYPIGSTDYVVQESDISTGVQYIENDVVYRIVNGTAIVIAYQGTAEKVVIPGNVSGASVTAVSNYAFYGCDNLKVIQFTGNAPAIAKSAFYGLKGVAAYPHDNITWTTNIFEKYSGDIQWLAHGESVHTWMKDANSSKEVTCESAGHYVWYCQICRDKKEEDIAAIGHNWREWTVSKEATYEADGLKERTCENCARKETETIAKKVLATPVVEAVSAVSGKKIKVKWTQVEGAGGYYVYYKTAGNGWSLLAKTDAATNSYTDSTPTAGISYTYTIRAYVTENGKTYSSGYESGKSATAKTAAPSVTVKELTYNKVQVTWNKVKDAAGYRVYRKVEGGSWEKLKLVSDTITSYTDSTVVPGTKYYYTVRGYCKPAGKALWGSYKTSKAITTKTAAPTLVSAKSTSYNKIKITWKSVDGANGYRVYRKTAGGSWKTLKNVSAATTSYTDTKATTGTTYYYTVKSYRKVNGKTVWGRYKSSGIKAVAKTAAPTLVSAKILSSGKTKITWKKVDGATGYRIYVKGNNGKWTKIRTVGASTTSYTYSKSYGKSEVYTVRAYRKVNGKNMWGLYKSSGITSK